MHPPFQTLYSDEQIRNRKKQNSEILRFSWFPSGKESLEIMNTVKYWQTKVSSESTIRSEKKERKNK